MTHGYCYAQTGVTMQCASVGVVGGRISGGGRTNARTSEHGVVSRRHGRDPSLNLVRGA